MSTDDRFDEIKRLLDSTVSEFQSLFQSAGGFEDSRIGNGWYPERITPDVYLLQPRPVDELLKIAEARKRSLFKHRMFPFIKPQDHEVQAFEKPRLKLIQFWRINGFHECFYFRGNSYKIDLPEDVVAVEVEGRIRDLVGHENGESQRLTSLTRRLLGWRDLSGVKAFRLNDVTELAYMYREGSFFVDSDGKENLEAEDFFERKPPLQKITEEQLRADYQEAEIMTTSIAKEDLVRRLHAAIVKPPAAFSRILSNRFQVTTLARYLMPVYSFRFEWHGQKKELNVHGFTGGFFQ